MTTPTTDTTLDPAGPDDDFAHLHAFTGEEGGLPGRPRRRWVTPWSLLLAALVIAGGCFYAGVRVERSDVGSGSSTLAGTRSAAFGAAGFARDRTGTGAATGRGFGGGGFGGAGAGGTEGTITTISGNTLDVTETGGDTVKVTLTPATTLKRVAGADVRELFPGDSVTIVGSTASDGTLTATALTDTGAATSSGAAGTAASTGTAAAGATSGSGLNALFGG